VLGFSELIGLSALTGSHAIDLGVAWWVIFWCVLPTLPLLLPVDLQRKLLLVAVAVGCVVFAFAVLNELGARAATWLAPESEWAYRWRYSTESGFSGAIVAIDRKPHNCEFMTAPIGEKHCHYEREIATVRVSKNRENEAIVSYDEGKSWYRAESATSPQILVSWRRVDD
jgi:hypothetical protein